MASFILFRKTPHIFSIKGERVHIPTGLLVEKWLVYYYPILESETSIPQINGQLNLAFSGQFEKIIHFYKHRGGFSVFYNDLKNIGIPPAIQGDFLALTKKIRETITRMPMRYIGRSITDEYYSFFKLEDRVKRISLPVKILDL